jgi:predicted amidohydrolase
MSDNTESVPVYTAGALQIACKAVNACKDKESAFKVRMQTLERVRAYVTAMVNFVNFHNGSTVRLICLPEYFLSGFPLGESHEEWHEKGVIQYDGPEYEFLGKLAQDNNIFLCGNVYEVDPNFKELYFQTCFIIGPNGDVILRYRRLSSAFEATPHDVLDKYLDIYGLEGLFPVAKTEIGNLACIASEEIMWPELVRANCLRGAEVLLHPTSEPGSPKTTDREAARKARALENAIYIVSANTSSIDDIPIPSYTCSAMSKVVDYRGDIMAEAAAGGESMLAHAVINIDAQREQRRRVGMANVFARQLSDVYAMMYSAYPIRTGNGLIEDGKVIPPPDREWFKKRQGDLLERLTKAGLL